jgi:replicative DNA helicase Mcm
LSIVITDRVGDLQKFLSQGSILREFESELDRDAPYLNIDLQALERWSTKYHDYFIDSPHSAISDLRDAVRQSIPEYIQKEHPINDFPVFLFGRALPLQIRNLRSKHLYKLVTLEGLVKKVSEVKPKVTDAIFTCNSCGFSSMVAQDRQKLQFPKQCSNDGCKSHKFRFEPDLSSYVDSEKLMLEEFTDGMMRGQPQSIILETESYITGKIYPGQRIRVTGILTTEESDQGKITQIKKLQVLGYDTDDSDYTDVDYYDSIDQILDLSKREDLEDILISSVAPNIYGNPEVKLGILLQQLGGVVKILADGSRKRGDFHILVVGDPGIAKSALAKRALQISPRGIYVSGKSSSSSGLTITFVKDDFGDGRWSIEVGALPMADGGICVVDELGQFDKKDLSILHEAMEEQEISYAKAGLVGKCKCRCGLFSNANPKSGRFDEYEPLSKQLDLPPPLLSRYDLIFIVRDIPSTDSDSKIADSILGVHSNQNRSEGSCIDTELLRKYIAYARDKCKPTLSEEAATALHSYYLKVRQLGSGKKDTPVAITPRQLEALVRISEAHAKMRLSEVVEAQDAKAAITLLDHCLTDVAYDQTTGNYDIDKLMTGTTHSKRRKVEMIRKIMAEHGDEWDVVSRNTLYSELEKNKIDRGEAEKIIDEMILAGEAFEPRFGSLKLV